MFETSITIKQKIMSVSLFSDQEIIKTLNTLAQQPLVQDFIQTTNEYKDYSSKSFGDVKAEDFIARAVWYGYIANTTAYNVQYQENEPINFNLEGEEDFDTLQEAVDSLSSLIYNCFTNDGNSFLQDAWMKVLTQIRDEFYEEVEVDIPSAWID